MARKELALSKLASELHADITRAEHALAFRPNVLDPLITLAGFQNQCTHFYNHLYTANATLAFMAISRLFDAPHGRLSVTLEDLVNRVERDGATRHFDIWREARNFRTSIRGVRERITKARGNIFAHRSYLEDIPKFVWADLENAQAEAKTILSWYGYYNSRAYVFTVPGYDLDCKRFVDKQRSLKWAPGL